MEEEAKEIDKPKEEVKKTKTIKIKFGKWKIITVILAILFIVAIFTKGFSFVSITGMATISAKDAADKAVNFINQNLLQGQTATLVGVEEENNLYKVTIMIAGKSYDSYVTKDGELLFTSAINMEELELEDIEGPETTTEDIPKTDKPEVELFVMSFCPFGNRAEDTMLPVYKLLKDKVDWEINYIVSVSGDTIKSLHGQPETNQNIREVCVKKYDGLDKFWEFTTYVNENCGRDGSCWEDAAKEAGIDTNKIQDCFDKEGLELMKAEAQATEETGATGSPTLIINGVRSRAVYQYGNPEAYKQAICSAFNNPPEECSEKLASPSSGSSTGGSC